MARKKLEFVHTEVVWRDEQDELVQEGEDAPRTFEEEIAAAVEAVLDRPGTRQIEYLRIIGGSGGNC